METVKNRREIAVREFKVIKYIARWTASKKITPNQISIASIGFSLFGLLCMWSYSFYGAPVYLIMAALAIQCRLLCNLFDGMVALEGGKKTVTGELFNDLPDRISDPVLLIGAGLICSSQFGMTMGWIAALLAVFTAYIRYLGVSMGQESNFTGPMAKQHRMALLTISLIVIYALNYFMINHPYTDYVMDITLSLMVIGLILTSKGRITSIIENSKGR